MTLPIAHAQILRLLCSPFYFTPRATTEIYTLSLHDALPISRASSATRPRLAGTRRGPAPGASPSAPGPRGKPRRSEEHTSELQSHHDLVCRLLLEKKKIHSMKKGNSIKSQEAIVMHSILHNI